MQEETNEKTIALYIKTGKLTAQQLQKAMKALLAQMKKQHDRQKNPHGKQTLKQLMKQNAGVSNIEITKDNIKAFESTAKKYGIDFALKKDSTEAHTKSANLGAVRCSQWTRYIAAQCSAYPLTDCGKSPLLFLPLL